MRSGRDAATTGASRVTRAASVRRPGLKPSQRNAVERSPGVADEPGAASTFVSGAPMVKR